MALLEELSRQWWLPWETTILYCWPVLPLLLWHWSFHGPFELYPDCRSAFSKWHLSLCGIQCSFTVCRATAVQRWLEPSPPLPDQRLLLR